MIKWIAMLLMVIDHIGYYLGDFVPTPVMLLLRLIGRLSFPLFAYSVALGFLRTKDRSRYFLRMLLFAVITQTMLIITSQFTGSGTFVNVMFTFSLAILFLAATEFFEKSWKQLKSVKSNSKVKIFDTEIPAAVGLCASILTMLFTLFSAKYFRTDYNLFGILSVFLFYIILKHVRKPKLTLQKDKHAIFIMFVSFLSLNFVWALIQIVFSMQPTYWALMEIFSVGAIGIILMDKPRPKPAAWEKYFFYFFYPLHMVLLMLVGYILTN